MVKLLLFFSVLKLLSSDKFVRLILLVFLLALLLLRFLKGVNVSMKQVLGVFESIEFNHFGSMTRVARLS